MSHKIVDYIRNIVIDDWIVGRLVVFAKAEERNENCNKLDEKTTGILSFHKG